MKQIVDLWKRILVTGESRSDRTGTGTLSIFGGQMEFDLRHCFPIVTIKKTKWRDAFIEMLWFLRGEGNTNFLKANGVNIWDAWAKPDGDVGPVYGVQWRYWLGQLRVSSSYGVPFDNSHWSFRKGECLYQEKIDQIKNLIEMIQKVPMGRRHIVTAWNPAYLQDMALPPCHRSFQCYVSTDKQIDLMMDIRSWDTVLGGPYNIAEYAFLLHLIGRATGNAPRRLIINYGDAHIYSNHVDAISKLLAEKTVIACEPHLMIKTDNTDIDNYKIDDFDVEGYESHPFLKLPIAV